MKLHKILPVIAGAALALGATSCLDNNDDNETYAEWRERNVKYINDAEAKETDGVKEYSKLVPSWAPSTFVLIKWYNDRSLTANNLSPLDNSTVDMKYELNDIDGNRIDSSYSLTTNGDSIYRTTPNAMIVGVRAALAKMHVGDSVQLVIPFTAGYGATSYGSIPPYSTLCFNMKLVGIPAWEVPN